MIPTNEVDLEFRVSFRIRGDQLDPDEISTLLGIEPAHAHKTGELRVPPATGRYPVGVWLIESALQPSAPVREHLDELLNRLRGKEPVLLELRERFLLDVFVGVFASRSTGGLVLEAGQLETLGRLGVALDLDLYLQAE